MYDSNKNATKEHKKKLVKITNITLHDMEESLFNICNRFYDKISKEKKLLDDFSFSVTIYGIAADHLQVPRYQIGYFEMGLCGISTLLYRMLCKDFLKDNYRLYDEEQLKKIENIIKSFGKFSNYYCSDLDSCNFDKPITDYIKINNKLYEIVKHHVSLCEDSDGFRFVFAIETFTNIFEKARPNNDIKIKIYYDKNYEKSIFKINSIIENFQQYIRKKKIITEGVFNIYGRSIDIPKTDWNQLKINQDLKNQINFHIVDFIKNIEKIKKLGHKSSRGIIICGHPGTGKTLLMRILISNLNIPTILVQASDLNPMQGIIAEHILNEIYEFANIISPVMIMFEDGDIFLGKRATNQNASLLSHFLNKLDGIKQNEGILTIVTSNDPSLLDEAVNNRPKRFDYILELPLPGPEERFQIIYDYLKNNLDEMLSSYLRKKVEELKGFSGAHLVEIAERMKYHLIYSNNENTLLTKEIIDSVIENFNFPKYKNNNEYHMGF